MNNPEQKRINFSPRKTSSRSSCCVYGCKSYASKDTTVRFHRLPKVGANKVKILNKCNQVEEVDRHAMWRRVTKLNKNFRDNATVCSLHFTEEDYVADVLLKHKRLKKTAVPSVNLFDQDVSTDTTKLENNILRHARAAKRMLKKDSKEPVGSKKKKNETEACKMIINESKLNQLNLQFVDTTLVTDNNTAAAPDIGTAAALDIGTEAAVEIGTGAVIDIGTSNAATVNMSIQTDLNFHTAFIQSEKDLNIATGILNFKILQLLESIVNVVSLKTTARCSSELSKLSVKDRIILSFMKLKQNCSYELLSVLFKVYCPENCRKIFLRTLDLLSAGLQYAIYWPKKEEIKKNIPTCFSEFLSTRAVIDVIEINIQTPKNLCCQIGCFSSYKGTTTIRFMAAVSPAGLITYISKPFMGRTSDKAIFEQSHFINLFEPKDGLMSDRGFLIDDTCLRHEVELIRPPFMKEKKQFNKNDAILNAKIAKARVHIERSNQRIKVFKILSSKVPSFLVLRIEQIFKIICAIVNLGRAILKDDKFVNNNFE